MAAEPSQPASTAARTSECRPASGVTGRPWPLSFTDPLLHQVWGHDPVPHAGTPGPRLRVESARHRARRPRRPATGFEADLCTMRRPVTPSAVSSARWAGSTVAPRARPGVSRCAPLGCENRTKPGAARREQPPCPQFTPISTTRARRPCSAAASRLIPIDDAEGHLPGLDQAGRQQPDDEGAAAARRPGRDPRVLRGLRQLPARARGSSTTTTTSSARPTATSPTSPTCGS